MVMPTFLRKIFHRVRVGFFLHNPFPLSKIYRTLPVRDEILQALLNCDLIGFHTFDYARHFLSCCSRMFGLDYKSKRGYIGLDYYGRTVSIKILPVGIHMGQIESMKSSDQTAKKVKELKKMYERKIVILGVDDMDMFKGISLKFLAMGQLLEDYPGLRGSVVLVQIVNPARSRGHDIQKVKTETMKVANEVNQRFGQAGYSPIVFVNGPVSTHDKVAYYAIYECVVVNAIRDGMNLVPYKYTVSRQSSPKLDTALGIDESEDRKSVIIVSEFIGCSPSLSGAIRVNPWNIDSVMEAMNRKSVIIVSEFIGCSPSLSGAIRVNPWNIDSVMEAMSLAITMPDNEKKLRHEKHYKYVSFHDVAYWARSFDQDLERACKEHFHKQCWGVGFGLGFRVVALGFNFMKLSVEHIVSSYKKTNSRLILLDYDGTVMPQALVDKTPSKENVVFIVSGRGKDSLSKWFDSCKNLGLSAEHGWLTRWSSDSQWESCGGLAEDVNWKKVALPVIEHYTEATDGSSIEQKKSALVWHHQEGVSKGVVVENLIASMQSKGKPLDFVLCIGDDRSDEDMFEKMASSVANLSLQGSVEVFACTVGQKPSMAKYYLDDTMDVIQLFHGLEAASSQLPKITGVGVSFETSV
ncbi:Glycosyl transferase, family 20 [Cynara cardunculus var. scolymus]|uniref:Glycosyl transferase, family 20 n=1 Tax=Cynara cardunculus var. scolymus TaxID=59895 RepID=A0A103YM69_CYNCS|nr:Glycosyl transferase, family 20 [Cynara cardunculus var. scolymus]